MRVLVFGGYGFIGQPLVTSLAKKSSNHIQVFDSFKFGLPKQFKSKKNLDLPIVGNICNYQHVLRSIERFSPDVVIHMAGLENRPESFGEFRSCAEVNYLGTANILQACLSVPKKPKRLFYLSSVAAADPVSHYGISKRASEDLLLNTLPRFPKLGIEVSVIRLTEIYGPSPSYTSTSLINIVADRMLHNQNLLLYGMNEYIDSLYIDDCVDYLEKIISNKESSSLITIGAFDPHTVKELADLLTSATDYHGEIVYSSDPRVPIQSNRLDSKSKPADLQVNIDLKAGIAALVKSRKKILGL